MNSLYIIGNGFDIYHGLKTRYSDFHQFLGEKNSELENLLGEYFTLEVDERYLWKNFEADLAHFNNQGFFDSYNHIDTSADSFKPSDCYGLEDEIRDEAEQLVESIREGFMDWILSVDYPNPSDIADKLVRLDHDAAFISFNYTDTLEELYSISKRDILYIHGIANSDFPDLIFGHGEALEDDPAPDELDFNGDSNRTMFTDAENAARAPFYEFQKDTQQIITEHLNFFDSLTGVKNIFVLGHSLGKADWPYFHEIVKRAPNANWHISYYLAEEKAANERIARSVLQIDKTKINMILVKDLCKSNV